MVWDAEKGKPFCTFVSGEYITEDETEKDYLVKLGYKFEGYVPSLEDEKIPLEDKTEAELKELAKSLGIRGFGIMFKPALIVKIREMQGLINGVK